MFEAVLNNSWTEVSNDRDQVLGSEFVATIPKAFADSAIAAFRFRRGQD
jgi:hypothetical protein